MAACIIFLRLALLSMALAFTAPGAYAAASGERSVGKGHSAACDRSRAQMLSDFDAGMRAAVAKNL